MAGKEIFQRYPGWLSAVAALGGNCAVLVFLTFTFKHQNTLDIYWPLETSENFLPALCTRARIAPEPGDSLSLDFKYPDGLFCLYWVIAIWVLK